MPDRPCSAGSDVHSSSASSRRSSAGTRARSSAASSTASSRAESRRCGATPGPLTNTYRAGVLAGRLAGRLLEERGEIDGEIFLAAGLYAAAIAQGAVVGQFEEPVEPTILKEHAAACIRVERRRRQLSAEDELAFYRWLTGELGVALTDAALAAYERMRVRRLERTGRGWAV